MDWNGLIPAIVTPMKADGSVDEAALSSYVKWLLPQGPVAIAVNTDAGEGPHLTPPEKLRVLDVAAGEAGGKLPIVCGLGGQNTAAALEFGAAAKKAGAAAWLVFPQGAFRGARGEDPTVLEYHRKMAGLGLPMIIFQLQEGLGGVEYPPETIAALAAIPEVQAIKEATFDVSKFKGTVELVRRLPRRIALLTGNDNFILESFRMGAEGGLLGFGAVATREQVEMVAAARAGDTGRANGLYARLNPLAQAVFAHPVRDYRARLKEVLRLSGVLSAAHVRPPLLPLPAGESEKLRDVLVAGGFLK